MKKLLLALTLLSPVFCFAQGKKMPKTYDLLIGTYTNTGKSKGIYVYRFYAETGKVAYLSEIDGIDDPAYLAVSNDHKFVYAANETPKGPGAASAFKFDAKSGKLELINSQPAAGGPAYISVDKDRKHIFLADYGGGNLSVLPINADGSLSPSVQLIQDKGGSIDKSRQEGPHVHTAVLTPEGKYLLYTDLGTDKINVYRYKSSKNPPLTPADPAFVNTTPGGGPRHIEFSPNGKYMYNIQEMGAAITAYHYNDGKFNAFQTVSMIPQGFKGGVGAADIHITPDGLFLYATNRGSANDVEAYAINQENGELTFIERYPTEKGPRNFMIDPTGSYVLVANQNSDSIIFFKIDKHTGKLSTLNEPQNGLPVAPKPIKLNIGAPVCLKMVPVE